MLAEDRLWDYGELPLHLNTNFVIRADDHGNPATLSIAPGTVVKLPRGGLLRSESGSLSAIGTGAQPIIFTSAEDDSVGGDSNGNGSSTTAYAGAWEALYLDGPNNVLSNVSVRYGGDTDGDGAGFGNTYSIQATKDLTLSNVDVDSSFGGGLRIEGASVTYNGGRLDSTSENGSNDAAIFVQSGALTASDLDISGNVGGGDTGIYLAAGQTATVSNSTFAGNTTAVFHAGSDAANANFQHNWWGDAGGPDDPSIADGTVNVNPSGQPVTDYVDYGNFLTSPPARSLGPRVVSFMQSSSSLDRVLVVFDRPIDATSLEVTDATLSGSQSVAIQSLSQTGDRGVVIIFDGDLPAGNHVLSLGPGVLGTGGFAMDQDADGIAGEAVDDVFSAAFFVDRAGPRIVSQIPDGATDSVLTTIEITFDEAINDDTFIASSVMLLDPMMLAAAAANEPFDPISPLGVIPTGGSSQSFQISFPPQTLDGEYELRIDPVVQDVHGNVMDQDNDGVGGEPIEDRYVRRITVNRQPLVITAQVPSGTTSEAIESIDVFFNVPIAEGSFSIADARLLGPAGDVPVISIERVDSDHYRMHFQRATSDGVYQLLVGPDITDLAGILMDGDSDGFPGELEDRYEGTLTLAGAGPYVTETTLLSKMQAPLEFIDVTFSEPLALSSFSAADITFTGPEGNITVTRIDPVGERVYRIGFDRLTTDGPYTLAIGPDLTDAGGSPMDQDQDGIGAEASEDVFSKTFELDGTGPRVIGTTPESSTSTALEWIDVRFDEPIDLPSFTPGQVTIVGPRGPIPLTQLIARDMDTVRVRFAPQTTPGDYTIVVGPSVRDEFGNLMDQDGDGIGGESEEDRFVTTIRQDLPNLQVQIDSLPATALNGEAISVSWTVGNAGGAIAIGPWTDRVVLSRDQYYGNNDDVLLGELAYPDNLTQPNTYSRSITGMIPFGITGDYRVFVETDSGDQVDESNEANLGQSPISIQYARPPADLIVDGIKVETNLGIGNSYPLTFRVRNDGTAASEVDSWTDRIYLSEDAALDGSDRLLVSLQHHGRLDANGSYTASPDVVIPSVASGDYYLLFQTDATDQLVEPGAEANNITASQVVSIAPALLPDLVITSVSPDASSLLQSGETITVNWSAANLGARAADDSWIDRVYLSADDSVSSDDLLLGDISQSRSLAIGGTYEASLEATLPEAISGEFYFVVVPDADNRVREGDGEAIGARASDSFDLALYPYADLTVSEVVAPELLIGDPVDLTVSWTVENVGEGAGRTAVWNDVIVLSGNDVFGDHDDRELGRFVHSGRMPSGTTYDRTETVTLPARTNGRFTLFVKTDANDDVYELEGDAANTGRPDHRVDVTTKPYADLQVDVVTAPPFGLAGESIEVSWSVTNRGIAPTDTTSWTDYFYLSADPSGATGLRLFASATHAGPLDVDAGYTQTTTLQLPRMPAVRNTFSCGPADRTSSSTPKTTSADRPKLKSHRLCRRSLTCEACSIHCLRTFSMDSNWRSPGPSPMMDRIGFPKLGPIG